MSKRPHNSNDPGPSASRARMDEPAPDALLATRMEKVLFREEYADVHLMVGDFDKGNVERIPATAAALCVFEAMFRGKSGRPMEVHVTDAEPEGFKVMLGYISTGEMLLDMDEAIDVLYLAKKYLLKRIEEGTARYISEHLTPQNVCLFLDCAAVLGDVMKKCWDAIDMNTTDVIRSKAFLQLSPQQLSDFVTRNTLCVEEIELYHQPDGHGRSCEKQLIALFALRFPVMDEEQFNSKVAKGDVLTKTEEAKIVLWCRSFVCSAYKINIKFHEFRFNCVPRARGRIRLKFGLQALLDGDVPHEAAGQKIGDAT